MDLANLRLYTDHVNQLDPVGLLNEEILLRDRIKLVKLVQDIKISEVQNKLELEQDEGWTVYVSILSSSDIARGVAYYAHKHKAPGVLPSGEFTLQRGHELSSYTNKVPGRISGMKRFYISHQAEPGDLVLIRYSKGLNQMSIELLDREQDF